MEIDSFWHILKTQFGYRSAGRSRFMVERFAHWATVIYYIELLNVILSESFTAQKGDYNRFIWAKGSFGVVKSVEAAGGKLNVSGLKALNEHESPVVYVANHMSLLDPLMLPCIMLAFGKVTFVLKESLLRYPIFGSVIRAVHPIAVSRKNPRQDFKTVLHKGKAALLRGCSVAIFPQATRSSVFDPASFNSMGVKLARKVGVSVVPVALKTDFQGNGRLIKDMGPVYPDKKLYIKFGKPMTVEGNGKKTQEKTIQFISDNIAQWNL